jgi:hypothetical protein
MTERVSAQLRRMGTTAPSLLPLLLLTGLEGQEEGQESSVARARTNQRFPVVAVVVEKERRPSLGVLSDSDAGEWRPACQKCPGHDGTKCW